jgi:hypothetical protein
VAFEDRVNRIASQQERKFYESEFKADVFLPSDGTLLGFGGAGHAFSRHCSRIPLQCQKWTMYCSYLYAGEDPLAEMAQRTILLTPVTLRAEASLQALPEKGTWGGARPGKGPKQRRDRAKLSTTVDPNLVIHSGRVLEERRIRSLQDRFF